MLKPAGTIPDQEAHFASNSGVVPDHTDFRLLVDSIPDYAIYMLDLEGRVRTWNHGARRLKGYEAQEIIGSHVSTFYTQEDKRTSKAEDELRTAREKGRFEEEGWRVRKDGTRFWANVVLTPIIDEAGVLRGYGKVTRDLTERRRLEQSSRLLVDSVKDYGIFLLDRNGVILSWNTGAQRIKGYSAGEIIGKHFSTFYSEADIKRNHPAEELKLATQKGRYEEEGWRVRKDGSKFWANVVITPLYDDDGQPIAFSKVTRDLTQKMLAEKTLRESEEKLRLMVASVKDYAIIMLDPEGKVSSWNQGAERIKGWKETEIIGKHFNAFYPPEDIAAGKTQMELEVAAAEGRFEDYGWRVRKDGTRFWANVVITALRDEAGKLRGFSKVTRDITEKKKAEEAIKKAFEELESFSYSVSHDLRAPLRSMDGFSDILLRTAGDKLDERSKGYLARIRGSSQRMAQLIDGLLDLSRLSRAPLSRRPIDLSSLAEKVIADLQKNDVLRKIKVKLHPNISVNADPILIQVVIENLLGNAWKYTSKTADAEIEFGVRTDRGSVEYFVKDNGAGFDMQYAGKLFGAFQRLHGADEFQGTGIGLATVKRIINRHGGDIWVAAEIGKGACFSFTIPESGQH